MLAEHAIVGTKIVPPLRNAVRFIDRNERWFSLGEHLRNSGNPHPLGRNEQNLQSPIQIIDAGLAGCGAVAPGVNTFDSEAALLELGYLILHEGDQRSDNQRGA